MKRAVAVLAVLALAPWSIGQTLTVFAAASLTEAFDEIAERFQERHPGARVLISFGASSTLATQIARGAPADVFASADDVQMQVVVQAGRAAGEPRVFTRNRLVMIAGERSSISTLEHLEEPGVYLVLAGPTVPVGRYARQALEALDGILGAGYSRRVLANLVSEEPNARQASLKVEMGEADAAIVYASDARALGRVRTVEIPDAANVWATYPMVAIEGGEHRALAGAFMEYVLSAEGQAVLSARGFEPLP
jgi:molybdate transport system substrate-binding protein